MAISNGASYIPTINSFLAHWSDVNASLPAPLALQGAQDLPALEALRTDLLNRVSAVQSHVNVRQMARGSHDILRSILLDALNRFNGIIDAYYEGSGLEKARPKAPGISVNHLDFTNPLHDARDLWTRIEALPAPGGLALPLELAVDTPALVFLGIGAATNMDQAQFILLINALESAYRSLQSADQSLLLSRARRDEVRKNAYECLKKYRKTAATVLPKGSPLLETMPRLTPEPGHTPEPVAAQAEFAPPDQARITFAASPEADLARYELHGVPGADWSAEDAEVIATLPPGAAPLEFLTPFGLSQPGASASFSVYVVLNTDREKGSEPMVVSRPL